MRWCVYGQIEGKVVCVDHHRSPAEPELPTGIPLPCAVRSYLDQAEEGSDSERARMDGWIDITALDNTPRFAPDRAGGVKADGKEYTGKKKPRQPHHGAQFRQSG